MIALLAGWAVSAGIPKRFAGVAAWATLIIGGALLIWGGIAAYNHMIISHHDDKAEIKVLKKTSAATAQAATERANDTIALAHQEEEAHNAIHQGTDAAPSPAAVRHNCERLRRAGKDVSRLPACGGRGGGH